jgi:Bifunctional DNA primase/polymerase, N-terminal./Primase C terminal 2 (PriCT-2).
MTQNLQAALRYAEMGWAVLPLHFIKPGGRCSCGDPHDGTGPTKLAANSVGKHPYQALVPQGVHNASTRVDTIMSWFSSAPQANIGIATGSVSGFDVLDVDPRNGGDDTLMVAEQTRGKLPETAIALTGGGGYHYLFKHDGARLRSPGRGVDIKSTGGYIVVEPSTHVSGGTYAWEGSADPTDGHAIASAPEWLRAPAVTAPTGTYVNGVGHLDKQRIADLQAALAHLDAGEYSTWISVGQALHSTEAPEAFELWDAWSQTAPNYDNSTTTKWRTFRANGPLHVESIFVWARDAGWNGEAQRVADEPGNIVPFQPKVPDQLQAGTPSQLLRLPGVLGGVVDLYNRTAPKPQPQFAVQAALALGSVVLGRRFRTTRDNWSAMYFVNVGKSASGKEHPRTVIEACLDAAGMGHLIGPAGYTSDSAVFSTLYHQPCHITVIDELGDLLGNAKAQGNFQKRQAVTELVKCWGLLHGALRPQGYSTMSLTPQQRAEAAKRVVQRPSLTLMAMTTPQTFYDSIGESSIEGGFLNRLLIVESSIGRQMSRPVDQLEVPDSVIEWCHAVRAGQGGNLSGIDIGADAVPTPRVAEFTDEARAAFRAYEAACLESMDQLDGERLAEMEGRSVEKAMRIALILAVSDSVTTPFIRLEHARWAIDYVKHYTVQTIEAIRRNMHGSQFAKWRSDMLDIVRRGGLRGRTEREMAKLSRTYAGMEPRMRKAVMDSLRADELVAFIDSKAGGGRGKTRLAWIATQPDAEDEAA